VPGLRANCTYVLLLLLLAIPSSELHFLSVDIGIARGAQVAGHASQEPNWQGPRELRKLIGDYRLIVILVEFTDVKHKTPRETIHQMVFEQMNQYWREVSYGQFNVVGDTVDWGDVGHEEAFYGKDTDSRDPGSDRRDPGLIADACRLATDVDFGEYQDIMVVYAGHGQDTDPKNTELVWPQAYLSGLDVTCGKKTFDAGAVTSETTARGTLAFGTFTHEFGHTIGLPDLYNPDPDVPTSEDYVGFWSLMAIGASAGPDYDGLAPTGLEAWSRIRMGWLSSVSVPLTSEGHVQIVNQIGDTTGPRAVKLAAKGGIYYLVEVRQKTGVDEYLPNSGVLITRIDESKRSGEGIVRVMDCQPGTKSINDATCKLDESWSASSDRVYVNAIARQGSGYIIAVADRPVETLDIYTAELSLVGVPSSASVVITLDGEEYTTLAGEERLTFIFNAGSTHTVTLSHYVTIGEDVRYYTTDSTVTISGHGEYVVNYAKQNRLLIQTTTATTEKWLAPHETVTLGPYDEVIQIDASTRKFFMSIVVDDIAHDSRSMVVSMDQPHMVLVRYVTQYYLQVISGYGDPEGEGWYNSGAIAFYSVTTPCGFLIRHVFVSWTGDITSTEPHGSMKMTQPYAIEASWQEDYSQLVLVSVAFAVVGAVFALRMRKRTKSISTPDGHTQFGTETIVSLEGSRWCVSCGSEILQTSVFCEHCGARQPDSQL